MAKEEDPDSFWQQYIKNVKPVLSKNVPILPVKKKNISPQKNIEHFSLDLPLPGELISLTSDKLTNRKIKKPSIDATLDLHGQILREAYPILVKFVEKAFAYQNRVILIITGKSLKKASEMGERLVDMVPLWLNSPLLRGYVKKVTFAKKEHGGEGAFYVFLEANSKKRNPS